MYAWLSHRVDDLNDLFDAPVEAVSARDRRAWREDRIQLRNALKLGNLFGCSHRQTVLPSTK